MVRFLSSPRHLRDRRHRELPCRRDHRLDRALASSTSFTLEFSDERADDDLGIEQTLVRILVELRGLEF
jgi:hypothetical protein